MAPSLILCSVLASRHGVGRWRILKNANPRDASFYDRVLWPCSEFGALTDVLYEHFLSLTIRALDEVLVAGGDESLTIDRQDDR